MFTVSIILTLTLFSGCFLVADWHARMVFVAIGYPRRYGHGKSWKRAHKHYKKTWSFRDRMLWRVVFKEPYESKYEWMAYWSYIHLAVSLIVVVCFLLHMFLFQDWRIIVGYTALADTVVFCIRVGYSAWVARGTLF